MNGCCSTGPIVFLKLNLYISVFERSLEAPSSKHSQKIEIVK